ncbi:hypothetical protein DL546_002153 [Coniochaeta pulveracea]|uniref:Erythromycin biosynthesis protein CIII-like C-terminal domain-containing protein n=1 Tax=Coniochaeta pulveracea TaxID=177199 RepID=A0A420XY97_9PEZI|nr:hypothetical protein DL546_002153 [Coniochaeta pulveracea]
METKPQIHPRGILLITNEDRGQANAFLATSEALLQADPSLEVHLASFPRLQAEVTSTSQQAQRTAAGAKPIVFHPVKGPSMAEGVTNYFRQRQTPMQGLLPASYSSRLHFSSTLRAIHDTIPVLVPYDGPQLVEIYSSLVDIIKEVDADLVVVDCLMTAALTACCHLKVRFVCLSPNAIKDFAARSQPNGAGLWKYPALFSGFSYPVPWYQIPLNIFFILYTVNIYLKDSYRRSVTAYLKSQTDATLVTPVNLIRNPPPGLKVVLGTTPELDFPGIIPRHLFPCGPIIRSARPLGDVDPELAAWLSKQRTLYINLGSICQLEEHRALELGRAVAVLLEQAQIAASPVQVLWKLSKFGSYSTKPGSQMHEVLGHWIDAEEVRIVDWLQPEPIAVLESGHIACFVHHGGANSFNEAAIAGVPQVVLPQWTDCYDYAQRVEMLGIGRLGNRTAKPLWTKKELGDVLSEVLLGKSSESIQRKASALAAVVKAKGNGAANAARLLLEECV